MWDWRRRRFTLSVSSMRSLALVLVLLAACLPDAPVVTLPDAATDASIDAPTDATCVPPAQTGCCAAMPDESAVQACALHEAEPGICGVVVCVTQQCTAAKIHFCS